MSFLGEFQTAMIAFRDAVLLQDFGLAQERLNSLSKLVELHWASLPAPEREAVHSDFMLALHWARASVAMNRDRMGADVERIEGAKIYQMPNPRARWNVHG